MVDTLQIKALSPRQTSNGQSVRRIPGSLLRIGTWNVRCLYEAGKLQNTAQEMERLKLDILGLSEVRWLGTGQCSTDNTVMYYSGNNDRYHYNGVGIIVTKESNKSVPNFVPYSDRILFLQLRSIQINLNIIQLHAPTADTKND